MNDSGRMVEKWWHELEHKFPSIKAGENVVMPNHFHGIVFIVEEDRSAHVGADLRVDPQRQGAHAGAPLRIGPVGDTPSQPQEDAHIGERGAHVGAPLPEIVQWFKTMTTNEYIRGVKLLEWAPFPGKLWQRNYYEHIVRDEIDLDRIYRYIANNPQEWQLDQLYPRK